MNLFLIYGFMLLALTVNLSVCTEVSINPLSNNTNNASRPIVRFIDLFCQSKNNDIRKALEGHLEPAQINQFINYVDTIHSGRKKSVYGFAFSTQYNWTADEMDDVLDRRYSVLTPSELEFVNASDDDLEKAKKSLQIRLNPGVNVDTIITTLICMEEKCEGNGNIIAWRNFYVWLLKYISKKPENELSDWIMTPDVTVEEPKKRVC